MTFETKHPQTMMLNGLHISSQALQDGLISVSLFFHS